MSIVHRYLLRELIPPFLVGIFLFTGVLLLTDLLELTELVVNKGIPVTQVVWGIVLQVPSSFVFSIPMSLIMAVVMTYGRMAHDNELLVLRSSGYSLISLSIPSLILAAVLSLGLLSFQQYGLPELKTYRQQWLQSIKVTNPSNLIHPKTYLEIPPFTVYAEKVDGKKMEDLYVEDRRHDPPRVIYSTRGQWLRRKNGQYALKLEDGTVHQSTDDGGYRILNFQTQTIQFNQNQPSRSSDPKSSPTLYEKYLKYQRAAENSSSSVNSKSNDYRKLATDFHRTVALCFASFFLVLVTVPVGIFSKRSGKTISLAFSLAAITAYYLILSVTEPLAISGWIPPGISLWTPNLLFGVAGILMFRNINRI